MSRAGFSIIEILVIMTILAVLMLYYRPDFLSSDSILSKTSYDHMIRTITSCKEKAIAHRASLSISFDDPDSIYILSTTDKIIYKEKYPPTLLSVIPAKISCNGYGEIYKTGNADDEKSFELKLKFTQSNERKIKIIKSTGYISEATE